MEVALEMSRKLDEFVSSKLKEMRDQHLDSIDISLTHHHNGSNTREVDMAVVVVI